jgi:putative hydrolase of the HAD superfamily
MTIFYIYLAAFERNWRLYDDALACLDTLRAYPLAIISNGDSRQQRRKLKRMGILSRFTSIVISGDLGLSKPHPDIFASSLQDLGVVAEEAVYVGDSLESDALGARDAGMKALWLARKGYPGDPATLPVRVITSLLQVKEVLNEL